MARLRRKTRSFGRGVRGATRWPAGPPPEDEAVPRGDYSNTSFKWPDWRRGFLQSSATYRAKASEALALPRRCAPAIYVQRIPHMWRLQQPNLHPHLEI